MLSLQVLDAFADETGNGGPLAGQYFSSVSRVAGREGWLLLILILRLRKGVASTVPSLRLKKDMVADEATVG